MWHQPYDITHTHDFHEFFVCAAGQGRQLTEHTIYPMREGDFFLFPAGYPHNGDGDEKGECSGIVLYLSENVFAQSIEDGDQEAYRILQALCAMAERQGPDFALSPQGRKRTLALFEGMAREVRHKAPGYRCAVKALIQEALLTVLRDPEIFPALQHEFRPSPGRERLRDLCHFLQSHFSYPITVEQMSDMAHLSRSQFHAVFKQETGLTLTAYLNDIRLRAAANMLRRGGTPILQVALQCGFGGLSHFYAQFNLAYGMTPHAYRRGGGGE